MFTFQTVLIYTRFSEVYYAVEKGQEQILTNVVFILSHCSSLIMFIFTVRLRY